MELEEIRTLYHNLYYINRVQNQLRPHIANNRARESVYKALEGKYTRRAAINMLEAALEEN